MKLRQLIQSLCVCMGTALLLCTPLQVSAQSNFNSYTYDEWDGSVAAPPSYQPVTALNGLQIGAGAFNTPQDFFMDDRGNLYLADTGNNRIVVMDADLNLKEIMETVRMDGEEIPLSGIEGLYVTEEGVIYAAQTASNRILIIENGVVINTIGKPVSNLISEDFVFSPTKVGVDMYGRAYVLSRG